MFMLFLFALLPSYVSAKRFNFQNLSIMRDGFVQSNNITEETKSGQRKQTLKPSCPLEDFIQAPKETAFSSMGRRLAEMSSLSATLGYEPSAGGTCWTKNHEGTGFTLWIYRIEKENRGLPPLSPGNYFALNAYPSSMSDTPVYLLAYKVRFYTDTMAEYYHGYWSGERYGTRLQFKLNAPQITCTPAPSDLATVGVRPQTASRQLPRCLMETGGSGAACYRDACMDELTARGTLQTCIEGGAQVCWFGIPYDMKNVDVLDSKGPFYLPGGGGRSLKEWWPDPNIMRELGIRG